MNIKTYNMQTSMGKILNRDTFIFLSEDEINQLNHIGYTGKGDREDYLNSLDRGVFKVEYIVIVVSLLTLYFICLGLLYFKEKSKFLTGLRSKPLKKAHSSKLLNLAETSWNKTSSSDLKFTPLKK